MNAPFLYILRADIHSQLRPAYTPQCRYDFSSLKPSAHMTIYHRDEENAGAQDDEGANIRPIRWFAIVTGKKFDRHFQADAQSTGPDQQEAATLLSSTHPWIHLISTRLHTAGMLSHTIMRHARCFEMPDITVLTTTSSMNQKTRLTSFQLCPAGMLSRLLIRQADSCATTATFMAMQACATTETSTTRVRATVRLMSTIATIDTGDEWLATGCPVTQRD